MERYIERDDRFQKAAVAAKGVYGLTGLTLAADGIADGSPYRMLMSLGSLLLFPLVEAVYRLLRLERGWKIEFGIYAFMFLSFTLGGCADFYTRVHGFDKLAHTLSGSFVALLALALYLNLERRRPVDQQSGATAALFVFFASMAVAGLFEIGEFALAPIVGRDLQRAVGTGVTDTMIDMIVCMAGTMIVLPLVVRFYRGRYDPFTGAAAAFLYRNLLRERNGLERDGLTEQSEVNEESVDRLPQEKVLSL